MLTRTDYTNAAAIIRERLNDAAKPAGQFPVFAHRNGAELQFLGHAWDIGGAGRLSDQLGYANRSIRLTTLAGDDRSFFLTF